MKLGIYGVEVLDGVTPLTAGNINKMNEQSAAVNMTQEVVTETCALGCTLDDAGNISHNK